MKPHLQALALLLCMLPTFPLKAQTTNTLVYDVTGLIDTSDYLVIHGGTLQWHHTAGGSVVGRHSGANAPTTISTIFNGGPVLSAVDWTPTWASPIPNDAYSSVFASLNPALPSGGILSVS